MKSTYPEWNCEQREYDRQAEVAANEFNHRNPRALSDFETQFGTLSVVLSNSLGKLRSKRKAIERQTRKAGRINQRYVVNELTRAYAGKEPDQKIYDRKRNIDSDASTENLGIGILLDQSGSTRFRVDENNRRIDLIKYAGLTIGRSLNAAGESFFVYSFHTHSDADPTIIELLKQTNEPWDRNIEERISAIEETSETEYYNNKDGAAIRFANEQLLQIPHESRYLFILSDGNPNCDNTYYEGRFAQHDTKQAMMEGKQKGIRYIYLTINPESSANSFIDLINPATAFCKRYTRMEDIVEGLTLAYESIKQGRY